MDQFIKGMLRPEIYDHPVAELKVIETHISWVILTGPFAYKLKKPVNPGFVDFTSLEQRKFFCHEEILSSVLARNELSAHDIERLAVDIARFHQSAAVATSSDAYGTPATIRRAAMANLSSLEKAEDDRQALARLRQWTEAEFHSLEQWFEHRHRDGFVRECHGDMHLGNMVLLNDRIVLFDCLEFNADLRWTDVMAEVAFLVMDLQSHGRRDLGLRFLNSWLEQTGDYRSLMGYRWYFAYRALVRAKVASLRIQQADLTPAEQIEKQGELQHYLDLSEATTRPQPRVVILMHGLSGSGKSYVSDRLCEHFPAIRVRSDIERKRLFGKWGTPATVQLTGDMYSATVTEHVYDRVLSECIPAILQSGFLAVIDAASLQTWQRDRIRDIAHREQARFIILDVQAPVELLKDRLNRRKLDKTAVSDADTAVLEHQLNSQQPLTQQELTETVAVSTDAPDWWSSLQSELRLRLSQP